MSFWNLSDGNEVEATEEFDAQYTPVIPDNTNCLACIDSAEWKNNNEGEQYINITWSVVEGEHQGFKVFQKVRVNIADSKKRDKAIRMLSAIDMNAGGHLRKLGQEPEDLDLAMHLANKVMLIKVMIWEMDDGKQGNWVSAVASGAERKEHKELAEEDLDF